MIRCWKAARRKFAELSSLSATSIESRWSFSDTPHILASDSVALCILESRTQLATVPRDYLLIEITVDTLDLPRLEDICTYLPEDWRSNLEWSRYVTSAWLKEQSSLALSVPTTIVPNDRLILLNPRHPQFANRVTSRILDFNWNHPLFKKRME